LPLPVVNSQGSHVFNRSAWADARDTEQTNIGKRLQTLSVSSAVLLQGSPGTVLHSAAQERTQICI